MADVEKLSPLNLFLVKTWRLFLSLLAKLLTRRSFQDMYLITAGVVLLASVLFWAILGAHLQVHNADQLSDPYLFSDAKTFHGAVFPSTHTFLLKWPIFWLLSVAGVTSAHLTIATVSVTLVTAMALAFILYKIERRPWVLGTLYLALAFILLLVPAQPYVGGLLPVNMAMLTTRNLEYALYLGCLVLFIRGRRLRSKSFIAGIVLLALLIASDKLFLGLSIGGAAVMLTAYALVNGTAQVTFAVRWLVGSVIAGVASAAVLLTLVGLHITHLTSGSSISPYGAGASVHSFLLGVIYGMLGFLTNIGANAAYGNKVIAQLPHDIVASLAHPNGLLYLLAFVIFGVGLVLTWRLVRASFRTRNSAAKPPVAVELSITLICSTIAAFGLFIVTEHYYAVDARYLAIGLFALAITSATVLRNYTVVRPKPLILTGVVLSLGVVAAGFSAQHVSSVQAAAFNDITHRNDLITQTLRRHKVDVLVGDYWRVLPVKLATHGKLDVLPLADCTNPTTSLTSSAWKPDLAQHSFAYLVTLSGSLTNYPACNISQITDVYGLPNAVQIIAGTPVHPQEAVLFYDGGSHPEAPAHLVRSAPTSLLPINFDQLTKTHCMQLTVMNVVAHEDDDLLFLSPDLLHNLQAGDCVRTVFMTAGDAGYGKFYWLSRQLGAEAAYSKMLGKENIWDQQTLTIAPERYVTVATLRGSSQVSLIFLNLPDGNLQGTGFVASGDESLQKLYTNTIGQLRTVDGQSSYTSSQLVDALVALMDVYQPGEIHTQADVGSVLYPDHSDHITTSKFADMAAVQYDQQHFDGVITIPVKHYIGYPIHGYDSNVSDSDLAQKIATFLAYGQYDNGVCHSVADCNSKTTYGFYLARQYQE